MLCFSVVCVVAVVVSWGRLFVFPECFTTSLSVFMHGEPSYIACRQSESGTETDRQRNNILYKNKNNVH